MNIVASSCLHIFLSVTSPPMTTAETQTAEAWARQRSSRAEPQFIFDFWQRMKNPTLEKRSNYLRLELSKLRATPELASFDPVQVLNELSIKNVENYKGVLNSMSTSSPITPKEVEFFYVRPYLDFGKGVFPPIVNSRDMVRHGFPQEASFYTTLVQESGTVGFKVIIHDRSSVPFEHSPQRFGSQLVLSSKNRSEFDLIVPRFWSAHEMISFFATWKPQLIEDFVKMNRFNLPSRIKTAGDFLDNLGSVATTGLNLDVLHRALKEWILTPPHYESLYRWALTQGLEGRLPEFERRVPYGVDATQFYFLPDHSSGMWDVSFPLGRHHRAHDPTPP
ncbi:MAG: hypothetical protein K2Q26_07455 [Bdellovibrionales bacterium]|nr:hypothetical protein [Bdellovibrionales bacterium]